MKVLRYKLRNRAVEATWSEANEKIVAAEADGGIYSIEDDGLPEETHATTDEVLNAFLGVD